MKSAGADVSPARFPPSRHRNWSGSGSEPWTPTSGSVTILPPISRAPPLPSLCHPRQNPGDLPSVRGFTLILQNTRPRNPSGSGFAPDPGPFGPNSAPGNSWNSSAVGLDLPSAWFQLTIQQGVDATTPNSVPCSRRPRPSATASSGASLAATNVAAETAAAPAKIQAFQNHLYWKDQIRPPSGLRHDVRNLAQGPERTQGTGLRSHARRMDEPEGPWFGLNMRVGFTPEQVEALRSAYRAAVEARTATAALSSPTEFDLKDPASRRNPLQPRCGTPRQTQPPPMARPGGLAQCPGISHPTPACGPAPAPAAGTSAFVVVSPDRTVDVFDFIHITEAQRRTQGPVPQGSSVNGTTSAAMIFEYNDRFLAGGTAAFDLYRRLGNAACRTDFVRLNQDGHDVGYQLVVEQVNAAFLRQNQL